MAVTESETIGQKTYCKSFGQSGAEVVKHNGDDVLVRDVRVAGLEVHLPRSHKIQCVLKRNLSNTLPLLSQCLQLKMVNNVHCWLEKILRGKRSKPWQQCLGEHIFTFTFHLHIKPFCNI